MDFLNVCSLLLAVAGTVVLVVMTVFGQKATYGRYSNESSLPKVDARFAWIVQECPAFFIPILIVLFRMATVRF